MTEQAPKQPFQSNEVRDEQSTKTLTPSGDPGRTPGKAEGDEESVEESPKQKE
ncbi:MAG: hypothetical protein ACR2GW_03470 [Pyrinomonadaceae bacterium]|nr:hypothetical protein [Acidobacteriota bacterium]